MGAKTTLRAVLAVNVGVLEHVEMALEDGLTVITGESGAGKSLVMSAIDAGLGARVSGEQVGPFGNRARIRLTFEVSGDHGVWDLLAPWDITQDDIIVLQREWGSDGKSVLRVQGQPVPVTMVREALGTLVDVAGQHEHQRLLKPEHARVWLDGFLDPTLLKDTAEAYRRWRLREQERGELRQLLGDETGLARMREEYQDLEDLDARSGEDTDLQDAVERLAHGERLAETYQRVVSLLDGTDGGSVSALLAEAYRGLEEAGRHDPASREAAALLNGAVAAVDDVRHQVWALAERLELDSGRLGELRARLDRLARAKRRFGCDLEGLVALRQRYREALARADEAEWQDHQLQQRVEEALNHYHEAATALHEARLQTSERVAREVTEVLGQLDMGKARVALVLTDGPATAHGRDKVEWWFGAHGPDDLRPLARTASGGELARVTLALRVVQQEGGALLLDEVDTGLGGHAARQVARLLTRLAKTQQVVAVSHQAVVAAAARQHWHVRKQERGSGVSTEVVCLNDADRIQEVARMLSGSADATAMNHARQILERAAD